jgi:hypothetical protein
MSHERPEASAAYQKDYQASLYFKPIDTREAKEGILHLQELLHIDHSQFHPFRIDPRTIKAQPLHNCKICGWEHSGLHLRGRPRALYVVADGQGELTIDQRGKLQAKPATDELGMPRTRFEYPKYRPAETSQGEEKSAPKINDDIIDTDRALVGRVFNAIKPLSPQEAKALRVAESERQILKLVEESNARIRR